MYKNFEIHNLSTTHGIAIISLYMTQQQMVNNNQSNHSNDFFFLGGGGYKYRDIFLKSSERKSAKNSHGNCYGV